jgi:hypothetical protein
MAGAVGEDVPDGAGAGDGLLGARAGAGDGVDVLGAGAGAGDGVDVLGAGDEGTGADGAGAGDGVGVDLGARDGNMVVICEGMDEGFM